ncbi:hypothetical protein [Desulfovibrio sp.]|nr:hypothetical protein [Desulfovibrio sp.]
MKTDFPPRSLTARGVFLFRPKQQQALGAIIRRQRLLLGIF